MLSAFIVVLLIGASYRGDPSADGPAKMSAHAQTISFAPSAGPGDINKLNKLTSTTKAGWHLCRPGSTVSPSRCLMR